MGDAARARFAEAKDKTAAAFAAAARAQRARMAEREEERRRRDPTYRPDAIDLSGAVKPFDRHINYYEVLDLDEFSSALEIKKAYMAMSLKLHPDKQHAKEPHDLEATKAQFAKMVEAFEILSDLPTRRAYDQARDHADASHAAG
eukprot:1459487-Prymnesium_polylepis.1